MNTIVKTMIFVNIYHNEEDFSYFILLLPSVKHIVKTLLIIYITALNSIIHPILLGIQHCGKLLEHHHHLQVSLTSFGTS